ncbi:MAG: hypothetical protein E7273_03790 [Pseudobutyrivibrio ruminis]|jgi:hypothetical protein|nr:hypothetical protein [Pseudobutyrivibrio ruminis]
MKKIECDAFLENLDRVISFVETELEELGCPMKIQMQITSCSGRNICKYRTLRIRKKYIDT